MSDQTFTINLVLERETKGALVFKEVDAKGNTLEIGDGAKVGTQYIRKTAYNGSGFPQKLEATFKAVK